MSAVITPFEGTELFNTASFNNRISQINTGFSYVSNPNLLDNWYFGNPVNQRGLTEYTGGYSIDRWKLLNNNVLAITNSAIELTFVDNNYVIWEQMESIPKGTYSLSLLFADGAFVTWSGVVDVSQAGFEAGTTRYKNWNIAIYSDKTVRITCIGSSGDKITILAAKLELGPTQTLAHQENGVWVLNEVPEYGEQLRRCQRYYYHVHYLQYQTINMAYEDTAYAFIMLPIPVEMRIRNPVVTQSTPITLGSSEKTMVTAEVSGCMARLGMNYDAISNPTKACYSYCASAGGVTFTLSADL